MVSLFKENKPKKAKRVYMVETLNPEKSIFVSLRNNEVCLCLSNKSIKTTFPTRWGALEQLKKYRELYRIPKK